MLFKVRVKNSDRLLQVYTIDEDDLNNIIFFVFDSIEQRWLWVLADNCIPSSCG